MREAIRKAIVEKARKIFSTGGISGTSMNSLARHCHISKPTLYKYYPSKTALLQEVIESVHRQLNRDLEHAVSLSEGVEEALKKMIRITLGFASSNRALFRMAVLEGNYLIASSGEDRNSSGETDGSFHRMFLNLYRERQDLLIRILEMGIREGALREDLDVHTAAVAIFGMIRGSVLDRVISPEPLPEEKEAGRQLYEFIQRGIARRR